MNLCNECQQNPEEINNSKNDQCYECRHRRICDIQDTLKLMTDAYQSNVPKMEIEVRYITGKHDTYIVPNNATIDNLKRIIEIKHGMTPRLFHLIHRGKMLPIYSSEELSKYEIGEGTKLHLVSRLR